MWFGELPTADAGGCILAHSVRLNNQRIKKGSLLSDALIRALLSENHSRVTVARLDSGDVAEDQAARQLATAVAGAGVIVGQAHTGRVNLFAANDGLLVFNRDNTVAINSIAEEITLSTLAENTWVLAGAMIATCKIITYAVPGASLEATQRAAEAEKIQVPAVAAHSAVLLQTSLASIKPSVLDKTRMVTSDRLTARGAELIGEHRCEHNIAALTELLNDQVNVNPDWILIAGASAISDRRDVIPAAIEAAGGVVTRFGLPVDPGNLLLLGELNGATVIGLPGCARSPRYNGLDQLLDRMACRVEIDATWLNSLSVGGLLTEMVDRPQPRVESTAESSQATIAGLVLAAGSSRRAGNTNKLLVPYRGQAMVRSVVGNVCDSTLDQVLVVTGYQRTAVESAVGDTRAQCVYCAAHAKGMAHSLSHGLSRLLDADAVMVFLADMPHVSTQLIDQLVGDVNKQEIKLTESIAVPVYSGRRGNPVIIGRAFFDTLLRNTGDTGAKYLMRQYPERVIELPVDEAAVVVDYDTTEALENLSDD